MEEQTTKKRNYRRTKHVE